jgi:protein-tyrosine-phosphatase
LKYLLFVCNHNAGRSQMAQAFFERLGPQDIRAESAGSQPTKEIWPEVIEAMRELGIDLSGRRPKKLTTEMQLHADWAVTMGCGDACPYVPSAVEDWEVPDPAGRPLAEVRAIRDRIRELVERLVAEKIDEIRHDPTAHQRRLSRLLRQLVGEFERQHTPEEIRACADAVLHQFDEARVRSHVVTLALREARLWLREEPAHFLSEVVATAGLILVIFSLARTKRAHIAPAAVGAYIGAAYFFTSSASFANPAISIGRMFSNTFAGIAPASVPSFIVAELVGGIVAVLVLLALYPDVTPEEAADVVVPHDEVRESESAGGQVDGAVESGAASV